MKKIPKVCIEAAKQRVEKARIELEEAKRALDRAYDLSRDDKFPDGMFILERYADHYYEGLNGRHIWHEEPKMRYTLHWCKDLGWFTGVGVSNEKGYSYRRDEVKEIAPDIWSCHQRPIKRRRGNKITTYNTLEKLTDAAQKFEVPLPLIEAFVARYLEKNPDVAEKTLKDAAK